MGQERSSFTVRVRKHVSMEIAEMLAVDIIENDGEAAILHLSNHKSLGWDGLINEFFKSRRHLSHVYFSKFGVWVICFTHGKLV